MKPDSNQHNPDPAYLRDLIKRAGLTQNKAADTIGISPRAMRYYVSGERTAPYPVQFALETLAEDIKMYRTHVILTQLPGQHGWQEYFPTSDRDEKNFMARWTKIHNAAGRGSIRTLSKEAYEYEQAQEQADRDYRAAHPDEFR